MPGFGAVVLAGGRSRRFGADKLALDVGGHPLLDAALSTALGVAPRVVVVGPDERPWPEGVTVVREEPAYAGPFAAVVAGALALASPGLSGASAPTWVLVLAGDLVDPSPIVRELLVAAESSGPIGGQTLDVVVAVDTEGRRQPLLALYRLSALLDAARRGDPRDRPARALLEDLAVAEVLDTTRATRDIDTPDDLARERNEPR